MKTAILGLSFGLLVALCSCGTDADAPGASGTDGAGGNGNGGGSGSSGSGGNGSSGECSTEKVFEALSPHCVSCHGSGASRPYFASLNAFTATLAGDPAWVTPGDAAGSELTKLLEGKGTKAYKQMPPTGPSYAQLVASGKANLTLDALSCWINGLQPGTPQVTSGPLPLMRRLTAEQIYAALGAQLGVDPRGFESSNYGFEDAGDVKPSDPYHQKAENFLLLGGPSWHERRARNDQVNTAFMMMFINVTQTSCRTSLSAMDPVLLKKATLSDTSATPDKIRANIAYMADRLLMLELTPEELDGYLGLYTTYENADGKPSPKTGWLAVCSAMLRDPRWISY